MASRHGPQFPHNISNALITNSTITNVNGNAYFNPSESHELELLLSKVSVAALHNSGERDDAPRCHPGTRVSVQADIMKWLDDVDDPQLVLWMYGSAGVGKSAIAQAIATLCYASKPCRLAGAFFLSRTAGAESGRGDEKRLVATLAYQMTINIPGLEHHIAGAIAKNRLVFDLDLETQIEKLILNPLAALSDETSKQIPPMIFILDALDECSSTLSQARIIKAFVVAIGKMQHKIPHKLLIASRPESHIKSIFAADEILPVIRSVFLNDNYKAQEDIQKFLVDGFARFRETHSSPDIFPATWPTDGDTAELVRRSSGHFIYASTAQKYIQEDHANPIVRLQSILDLSKDSINRPFVEIDALYSHIFWQVKDLETVLYIICISRCCSQQLEDAPIKFCESLLGLLKGEGTLALQGLSSVMKVDYNVQAYHASLDDFLQDKDRSGDFWIYSNKICVRLCCLALQYIPPLLCCDQSDSVTMELIFCFAIFCGCTKHIQGPNSEIHNIFSAFDLDMIFQFVSKIQFKAKPNSTYLLRLCSELFQWLFKEHQMLVQSNDMILLPRFSQLQNWTLGQLKKFQFDRPPSSQSLDNFEKVFLCRDAEMYLIRRGLAFDSWVVESAPWVLNEDRITQLMSQYCYYISNSAWLDLIRDARLNPNSDGLFEQGWRIPELWTFIFLRQAPLRFDQYLDIQHILGLNSSISTAASQNDFRKLPVSNFSIAIIHFYWYLGKVEKEFPCLKSPLNELEESTSATEQQVMDRRSCLPYIPHPSDPPSFALALTFHTIHHIEYQDTELLLPVI